MTMKSPKPDALTPSSDAAPDAKADKPDANAENENALGASLPSDSPELPLIPGTEQPRSLGDIIRVAEQTSITDNPEQASSTQTAQVNNVHVTNGQVNHAQVNNGQPQAAQGIGKARRSKKPPRSQARRYARERALQALYQWDLSNDQSTVVREQFMETQDMSRVDVDYFLLIYNGVTVNPQKIDDALATGLDRPINELDPIERAVLRVAAFELCEQNDIPARVVINEGIEITKRFGADKGHRYVNGVLDKLASHLRPQEMKSR